MNKNKVLALLGAVVLAGQMAFVSAAGTPGSSADPVVTESYVTAKINAIKGNTADTSGLEKRLSDLEMKVSSLEKAVIELQKNKTSQDAKITSLENTIAELQKNQSSTPTPSTPATGISSTDLNILYHMNKMNMNKKYGAIARNGVQLKASPSDSSKTITTLNYYAGVNLLDASNGWIKISIYQNVGWVKYTDVLPIMLTT